MSRFRIPTQVRIAPGCLAEVGECARELGLGRVLLVVDPGLAATPWPDRVRDALDAAGIECSVFDAVEPNPRTTTADAIGVRMRHEGFDGAVALGGGSAIDAAKAGVVVATNPGKAALELVGREQFEHPPLPLIAVPTTCGTGSEVTWVSVLSDVERQIKISIKGVAMFPDVALVDADLVATLPAHLIAWTGMDALTHALEATTCNQANPVSDALAEKAIELLLDHLPLAASNSAGSTPHDAGPARAAVMRASTLAGLAFGNSDVAAVHCLSESLGGLYDVAHGLANAVLLAPVLRAHGDSVAPRLAELEARFGTEASCGASTKSAVDGFLNRLDGLARALDIPKFSTLDVPRNDFGLVASRAAANGSNPSNPRPMGEAEYLQILAALD